MSDKEKKRLEEITKELLGLIGEDSTRQGLMKTPKRVAESWKFLSQGYHQNLDEIINEAIFDESAKDMIIVKDIEFYSLCEHHLIPFYGKAHVGYIPDGKIIGLSKIPRVIDFYARILQVQERLTEQIRATIALVAETEDVAVQIDGLHFCVKSRGIQDLRSSTATFSASGQFEDGECRREFLAGCRSLMS